MNNKQNMLSCIYNKLHRSYYTFLAAKAGINFGENNEFMDRFWSSAEPYLITIGSNCQITKNVRFFTHGGSNVARKVYSQFDCFGKIVVGSNVYIGNNALIMPGVSIGNNVLIAAGSVVTKSVPDNVVVGGNPARIICTLEDYVKKNLPYNLNTKGLSYKEKKRVILDTNAKIRFIKKSVMGGGNLQH